MSSPVPSSAGSRSRSASPASVPDLNDGSLVPDLPDGIAASCLRKLVALELTSAGFDSANQDALDELEGIVLSFFESLVQHAHELANHAQRGRPNALDLIQGCKELGVGGPQELREEMGRASGSHVANFRLRYDRARKERVGPLLASDDEASEDEGPNAIEEQAEDSFALRGPPSQPAMIMNADGTFTPSLPALPPPQMTRAKRKPQPVTKPIDALRADYLPPLPAKHSYKQTPVFPIPAQPPAVPPSTFHTEQSLSPAAMKHLSTLRARLNDSQLVASSLRNLIRRTSARTTLSSSNAAPANAMVVDGQPGPTAVDEEEDLDVVDYEGEWYGGQDSAPGRSITVLRVGADGTIADAAGSTSGKREREKKDSAAKGFGADWSDAGRVGTGKRRKWRV